MMPRGGRRTGTPGQTYTNRSDLSAAPSQPVQAGPSQVYGQRAAQEQAQSAMPLPALSPPGAAGPLDRMTERPNEPIHAGLSTGPGPGAEALGAPGADDQILFNLYRAYQIAPSEGLRSLIASMETNRGIGQ